MRLSICCTGPSMNDLPTSDLPHARLPQVRITTGARVHLGLLDTVAPFGGIGVMVDQPATEIRVSAHSRFLADETIRDRATEIATRVAKASGNLGLPACRVELVRGAAAHCGLGSGTQVSMAIAEAMLVHLGIQADARSLAVDFAQRGKRSAVGVHGYHHGGLIFEDADSPTDLNPMQRRVELPGQWRILLVRPRQASGTISGDIERQQFANLGGASGEAKSELLRILVDELLPAAKSHRFDDFACAVTRYNRQSGMLFSPVQGGPYHGRQVSDLVDHLQNGGVCGVGQSSWGPGVFAWFENDAPMQSIVSRLPRDVDVIAATGALNTGRSIRVVP